MDSAQVQQEAGTWYALPAGLLTWLIPPSGDTAILTYQWEQPATEPIPLLRPGDPVCVRSNALGVEAQARIGDLEHNTVAATTYYRLTLQAWHIVRVRVWTWQTVEHGDAPTGPI